MKKGRHLGFGRALESSALLFAPRLTVSSLLLTPHPLGLTLLFLLLFPSRRPPFKLLTNWGHRTTFPTIPRAGRPQWGFPWAAVVINVANPRFRGRDELLSTSSLRCPFSPPPGENQCWVKTPLRRDIHSGERSGYPLPPRASAPVGFPGGLGVSLVDDRSASCYPCCCDHDFWQQRPRRRPPPVPRFPPWVRPGLSLLSLREFPAPRAWHPSLGRGWALRGRTSAGVPSRGPSGMEGALLVMWGGGLA